MLIFKKINEVYFEITLDSPINQDQLDDLYRNFMMFHPNKENTKAFKMGKWDGKIRFINYNDEYKESALAPIGLFNKYYKFMRLNDIDFAVENDDFGVNEINIDDFDEFIDDYHPKDRDRRDYQIDAVKNALVLNRCVLESPTGSGKSLAIYLYLQWLLNKDLSDNEKILLVVPTVDLVEQMFDDLVSYGFDPHNASKIYSGIKKNLNKQVIISTWQSLQHFSPEFFEQFQCLIIDECHKASANKLSIIGKACVNSRWRFGTTATLHNDKMLKYMVLSNFGPIFRTSTTEGLIKKSYLTDFSIRNIVLNWVKQGKRKKYEEMNFDSEYKLIIENEQRLKLISEFLEALLAEERIDNSCILVLGNRIEYLERLYEIMSKKTDKVDIIHGKIDKKLRKETITEYKSNGGLLIANIAIMGTGINIPNVDAIVFITPLKSDILVMQSIGRSIRLCKNKKEARIFDFVDNIPMEDRKMNTTLKWMLKKQELYDKQHFKYDFIEYDLFIKPKKENNVEDLF
jgi:superfamily II DNA or RNA helicase